jgi:hypothetical protein
MKKAQEFAHKLLAVQRAREAGSKTKAQAIIEHLMQAMEKAVQQARSDVSEDMHVNDQSVEYNCDVVLKIVHDYLVGEGFQHVSLLGSNHYWTATFSLPDAIVFGPVQNPVPEPDLLSDIPSPMPGKTGPA